MFGSTDRTTWLGRQVSFARYFPMDDQTTDEIADAQAALGRALRDLRRQTGMTQKQLAARAGADDTYISQVETGRRDIRWSTVTRLLLALGVSVTDLATAIEHQERTPPR
jgi:DNA-binding XRE family transcriptional regulator